MDTTVLLGQATLREADVWAWRAFVHFRYHP